MPLSDLALRKLKPTEKAFKLADGGNLYLLVKPNGTKTWRMDYAFLGKRKTMSFGLYPTVSLSAARARRESAKSLIAKGIDPSTQKKLDRAAAMTANANTFGAIAHDYLAKLAKDGRAGPTIIKNTWMMKELAKPLERRPITQITAAEVLGVLRSIEQSGRIESALATRAAIGRVFRFAIATARAENDPTFALRGALQRHVPTNHAAVTSADEVGALMRAIYGYEGWPTLAAALKIQALCFARPGETRLMEWKEVDLENAKWIIPEGKTKMRRPHEVPLSSQAIEVIKGIQNLSGLGRYVFPSMMSGKAVLSENSMNSALRRMGYTNEQHTAHGFRSTASTILNESRKFHPDVIEAQLAHRDRDSIRRIYNRAAYWEERVPMMQWWADFLDERRLSVSTSLGQH